MVDVKANCRDSKVSYFDDSNIVYGSLYKTPEKIKTKGRGSRGKQLTCYTLAKPFKPYLDLWLNYRKEHGIDSEWLLPKKVNGEYIDEPMDPKLLVVGQIHLVTILERISTGIAFGIILHQSVLAAVFPMMLFKC